MKVVNQETGESYQLNAGTRLEVERPNLFFSEYDEQSLPVEMPDTAKNRRMMGYPDQVANVRRPRTDIPCLIEDGGFVKPCRQAVIAAQRHASITSSFYFDENALMGKMRKKRVKDLFGMETIPGITTVEEGIAFCEDLLKNQHPDYTIFQVALEENGQNYAGLPTHKFLNLYGFMNNDPRREHFWFESGLSWTHPSSYYNAVDRTEDMNGKNIRIGKGYYMTPFMRANTLLKRLFSHWGYTIADSLFTQNEGFRNMVVVNRCADALANGRIYLCDLVPDCTCYELLEAFRKMFMCQFEIDEQNKVVTPVFFKDVLDRTPRFDITPLTNGHAQVEAPETYKRVVLSPDSAEITNLAGDRELKQSEVRAKYPSALYSSYLGLFYRDSYIYDRRGYYKRVVEYIKDASGTYDYGGILSDETVSIPVHMPAMTGSGFGTTKQAHLLVGGAVFLNSKIVEDHLDDSVEVESGDTQADKQDEPVILAYRVVQHSLKDRNGNVTESAIGCLSYIDDTLNYVLPEDQRYDLTFTGANGIYERFYRTYDNLLRNSLWNVNIKLRVDDNLRNNLLSYEPLFYQGQKYILDTFRYVVGGEKEEAETTLRTVQLYEPLDVTPPFEEQFGGNDLYRWVADSEFAVVSQEEYESSPDKDKGIPGFFPPLPSEKYADGKRHYEKTTVRRADNGRGYTRTTVWLTCVRKS